MLPKNLTTADTHGLVRVLPISICVFALLHFTGCATGNYQKADAASESLQRASLQIDAENHCIDMTMVQLGNLVNKPAPDLKPQFEAFSASLDRLVASAQRADKATAVASQKSKDYFQDWDKAATINFEAVRDQSVSRKTQVSNEFNTVDQRYRENQEVIKPLISYLQDIHTALSTDLTMGGLQSVKPLVENAEQNADKVQSALERLTTDLDTSGSQMSSVVPQETEARGGVVDTDETTREHAQSPPGKNAPAVELRKPRSAPFGYKSAAVELGFSRAIQDFKWDKFVSEWDEKLLN